MKDDFESFVFTPDARTGMTVFTGIYGSTAPEGFTAVYDEREKAVTVSGRLTLKEFLDLAKFLEAAERLKSEWTGFDCGGTGNLAEDGAAS